MKKSLCFWIVGINTPSPTWVADYFEDGKPVKWCGDGSNYEGRCKSLADGKRKAYRLARRLGAIVTYDGDSTHCFADC